MADDTHSAWRSQLEASTQTQAPFKARAQRILVPGLTILAHPEWDRVGEQAHLPALTSGRGIDLSRLSPAFAPSAGGQAKPLIDTFLSRQPFRIEAIPRSVGASPESFIIERQNSAMSLAVDGEAVGARLEVAASALDCGAVLLLADRVVLLLHWLDPQPPLVGPDLGLVGDSRAMIALRKSIHQVADLAVPVLLRGETGTGKELAAAAIHRLGERCSAPYVCINMAAIPPDLAAAELFGAAKGAFTGADKARAGLFKRAHGGTLFLDEIGETPTEVQALLLRALESQQIRPLGTDEPLTVDVRILAATDADLEKAVAQGRFRAPLLHRLGNFVISLPPLRQRREDLGLLVRYFLRHELADYDRLDLLNSPERSRPTWLPAALVDRLTRFDWPGNVRQLRNLVRHLAVTFRDEEQIPADLALDEQLGSNAAVPKSMAARAISDPPSTSPSSWPRQPSQIPQADLIAALRRNRWRLKPTARELRISRTSLYALVDRFPSIRRASDLDHQEIEQALEITDGDLEAMVDRLEVSKHGLLQRMRELNLP